MTGTFEVGKIYFAKQRIDRLYFKVIDRTPKTVTVAYLGRQHDVAFKPHKIDDAGDNATQKIRIYTNAGEEYGYLKIECNLYWLAGRTERIEITADDEVLKESMEVTK